MKYTRELIEDRFRRGERLKYIFFWGHKPAADGSIARDVERTEVYQHKVIVRAARNQIEALFEKRVRKHLGVFPQEQLISSGLERSRNQ